MKGLAGSLGVYVYVTKSAQATLQAQGLVDIGTLRKYLLWYGVLIFLSIYLDYVE